jgi:hypothetical protein
MSHPAHDYDNTEHISTRKLTGVQKKSMAMTYQLVVQRLKHLSQDDFKQDVLGMIRDGGVWKWPE